MNEKDTECVMINEFSNKIGSYFNDKVWIAISPAWLENLSVIFKKKALDSTDYVNQGFERKQADFFDNAYRVWRDARKKFYEKVDINKENDAVKSLLLQGELFDCVASEAIACRGECVKACTIRTVDKNSYVCPYLRLKRDD